MSRDLTVIDAFCKAETENDKRLSNIMKSFIKFQEVSAKFNKAEIDYLKMTEELKPKIRPVLFVENEKSYIFAKEAANLSKFIKSKNLLMDTSLPLPKTNIDNYL